MNTDIPAEVKFLEAPETPERYQLVARRAAPAMEFNSFPRLKAENELYLGQIFGKYPV